MSKLPEYLVKLGQKIDKTKIKWGPIHEDEYTIAGKNNDRPFKVPRARYYYDDNGVKKELYLIAPEQYTFGVSPNYNDLPKDIPKGTPESTAYLTGYQVSYPMNSMDTIHSPTEDEKIFKENIDAIYETAFKYVASECKKKSCVLPKPVMSGFKTADADGQPEDALRPLYSFSKKKDSDELDKSKPARMYIPLMSHGKGVKLVLDTPFYPYGKRQPKNPLHYLDKRGNIRPIIRIVSLTLSGGKNYSGSFKIEVYEADYTPVNNTQHTRRLLPVNENANEEEAETTALPPPEFREVDNTSGDESNDDFVEEPISPPNLVNDSESEEEDKEDDELAAKKKASEEKRKALLAKKRAAKKGE